MFLYTQEYPDYYEIIKKPIDMQKIQARMLAMQYDTIEDMVSDFVLMFDNACKYNEPDSLIYKVTMPTHFVLMVMVTPHTQLSWGYDKTRYTAKLGIWLDQVYS